MAVVLQSDIYIQYQETRRNSFVAVEILRQEHWQYLLIVSCLVNASLHSLILGAVKNHCCSWLSVTCIQ